jgi:hypothetical protein
MLVSQLETGETEWPQARTGVAGEALYFYLLLFPDIQILGQMFWMTAAISGGWIGLEHSLETGVGRHVQISQQRGASATI